MSYTPELLPFDRAEGGVHGDVSGTITTYPTALNANKDQLTNW